MLTIELQLARIEAAETIQKEIDFELLLGVLARLRRYADLADTAREVESLVRKAIEEFDDQLPGLRRIRNILEHLDEYSMDAGRDKSIDRQWLEVRMITDGGRTWSWLGESINIDTAYDASVNLFRTLKAAKTLVSGQSQP